ncbi:kinase-like protein [Gloeophyllum trabeum ATCC 11539]|uniref:non-specific serine/threonine protein kinase n=1 Tax=Gloeophyllum trabeum (strain ATCC 11539 / FP-39264 / Madison 617) TaxID=670483 RepID=S7QLH2_GLOTA|nr:kinase-like protein [Gloeophyllum trabeum ATCC 11539]EPQ60213.1 kinase-like protein [Gloeophyllum trabeum ATCC 11539]
MDPSQSRPFRRGIRVHHQDGPWTISVAENPHDPRSYSLYVKTPTHNLTLMRTATEIVELHHKLRESNPNTRIPSLPIDVSLLSPPAKRKSAFLNTLSRLASPSGGKTSGSRQSRNHSSTPSASAPSNIATPTISPSQEIGDPFAKVTNGKSMPSSSVNLTALAAYLTDIANDQLLRTNRAWKRFVRVRTDDLESVRIERAIKRVRSDLASHVSPKTPTERHASTANSSSADISEVESFDDEYPTSGSNVVTSGDIDMTSTLAREVDIKEEDEEEAVQEESAKEGDAAAGRSTPEADTATLNGADGHAGNASTSDSVDQHARIPRSQSADPMTRLSKTYTPSTLNGDSASQTGDESSISTSTDDPTARKKRSRSSDPHKQLSKKKSQRKVVISDFEMIRVLGKGCAGKVLLVRHKTSSDFYALKAITKRHVLAHQELQHTLTEQAVLKRMAAEGSDPFVVKLWWSFHDKENLYLVMDFHPGGDLATQLARWGRLGRDRARFYAAEIVEGVEGLHAAGVIYRDLKPENILIGGDGHIVLTDFGLSKEFPRRTNAITAPPTPSGQKGEFYSSAPGTPTPTAPHWMKGENGELSGWPGQPVGQHDTTSTFCGTAEYLAPEVIQGLPYSYEVDWWSFGTMLYEMLTGITPFWANNHSDMYVRVLQDELQFPEDRTMDQDTKSLIRGLLQRNPALRICEPRIKKHPYFSMIDWSHVYYKRYIPPYIPPIDPSNASDTQNFDDTFLEMEPVINDPNENDETDTDRERDQTDTDRTDGEDSASTPLQSRSPSVHPGEEEETVDVFDGYSFKGRHSILIDDDEEVSSEATDNEAEPETEVSETADVAATSNTGDAEGATAASTPEARSAVLPAAEAEVVHEALAKPEPMVAPTNGRTLTEVSRVQPADNALVQPSKKVEQKSRPKSARFTRSRREKSGIPALDKYLSDAGGEETEATERDEEDDDWDFVEAGEGEERNGSKGPTLFSRGVVDRYRLALRKGSTPARAAPRVMSSKSSKSEIGEAGDSPSPSEKQRRGRTPGLTFRKHPRQFLRAKSPPSSTQSSRSVTTVKSLSQSASATVTSSTSNGFLTPASSDGTTLPMSPSLKSKESATSVGNTSVSSDQSGNGDGPDSDDVGPSGTLKAQSPSAEEPEKQKNKKLKKYKEGAEKVLSLFAPPR